MIEYRVRHFDDGVKMWWLNGKRHREDGPAYESANGVKRWYLNNKEYTEDEFNKLHSIKVVK